MDYATAAGVSRYLRMHMQAFRQVNFQEDAGQRGSGRPSLLSLDNDSQVDDDDDDDDDAESDEDEEDIDDDRSVITTSSSSLVRNDAAACIDGTATPVWHRMLHRLNQVYTIREEKCYFVM